MLYNFKHEHVIKKIYNYLKTQKQCLLIIAQNIFTKRKLNMEVEKENITGYDIELYLDFNWNYEKQEEKEEKGDVAKRLAKTKRGKRSIQQRC